MTNGEKIRASTDEELADLVFMPETCPPHREWSDCTFVGTCKDCRLDWLRQEAKNDA